MARRKDISSKEDRNEAGVKRIDNTKITAAERTLNQDLTLSKGEREKGASPAYAIGKKVERKEKRGR
jgi:hypothetical protein